MNTQAFHVHGDPSYHPDYDMLIEVDFKWLMAGQGCWIDPDKLRSDPLYARACLESALGSDCEPLRHCAASLQDELNGIHSPSRNQ